VAAVVLLVDRSTRDWYRGLSTAAAGSRQA